MAHSRTTDDSDRGRRAEGIILACGHLQAGERARARSEAVGTDAEKLAKTFVVKLVGGKTA
jgi:hypothetical protein